MTVMQRVDALRARHKSLDSKIQQENRRPYPDDLTISRLKKEKLRIKEEMIHLRTN